MPFLALNLNSIDIIGERGAFGLSQSMAVFERTL